VVVFLISVISGENLGLPTLPTTWLALAYLVLFGTCAIFLMFLYLLKKWPASRISYQFVFFPFVALAASAWLTHEPLSPVLLVGAAVVLLGVLIGVARLSKRRILMPARVPVPVPVRVEKKLK
jgi:drug/metabolite transporter (DMT)-like permease